MSTLAESVPGLSQHNPDVASNRQLSRYQTVVFTQYTRAVLPADGYVFWVRTSTTFAFYVSIHYAVDSRQLEDESVAINRIVVTAETEIQPFNDIAPDTIWVGTIDGVQFAFSQRGPRYNAADLFHYSGDAVYPTMTTQLIDSIDDLPATPIVSNSLPAWLALSTYSPHWLQPPNPAITLYPSFAVPENLRPPYGSVHIEPRSTRAIQAFPSFAQRLTHSQLSLDRVIVTLYGLTSNTALDWIDLVINYMRDTDVIGMTDVLPIVQDDKRVQNELDILAQKKTVTFEVSYIQSRVWDVARQLILAVPVGFFPTPGPFLVNDGGVLAFADDAAVFYPLSFGGLPAGAVWSDGLAIAVVPGITPDPYAPPLYFGQINATELLSLGGGNLPLTPPTPGTNQLWNNGGLVCVA